MSDFNGPTKQCPGCNKELAVNVAVCPFCHYDYLNPPARPFVDPPKQTDQPKSADQNTASCCGWIIAACVAIALWFAFSPPSKDSASDTSKPNWNSAYSAARNFVRDTLKSPSTASFPFASESFVQDLGNGKYRVRAYVDAENSFGAKIRSDWMVVEHWAGDGNYQLDDIAVNAR